ncbi:MAG: hypothetical protein ACWA6X_11975, partial [Bauldia sp.]
SPAAPAAPATAPTRDVVPATRGQVGAGRAAAPPPADAAEAPATATAYTDDGVTVTGAPGFTLAASADAVAGQGVIPPCDAGFDGCYYFSATTYAGTNFESAGLRILKRTDLATAAACLGTQPDGYTGLTIITHDGGAYSTALIAGAGDAGMGHYANDTVYRLAWQGGCWEFETRIGATQFGNYTPGTIREFTDADNAAVAALLRAMVDSVRLPDGTAVVFPAAA